MPNHPRPYRPTSTVLCLLLALALSVLGRPAPAQDYPNRPVTILVPLGAGTVLAANDVAHGTPDGYTLLDAPSGTLTTNVALYQKLSYDPEKDLIPVALYCQVPFVLVTNPSQPYKSVPELIAYAKAHPSKLSFGSTGTGAAPHLAGEMLKSMAGIEMVHVPYKGGPPALNDIMGDHIQLFFADTAITPPLIKAGKIRALGVSSKTRAAALPDVPPIADSVPGFDAVSWHLIVAPSRTPRPIVNKLHDDFKAVIKSPEIWQQMIGMGLIPIDSPSVEDLQGFVKSEMVRWGDIVQRIGIAKTE